MANLQIKGVEDDFYEDLKRMAKGRNRSVSQQVLTILKEHMARKGKLDKVKTPAAVLLELSGSWTDERSAGEIVGQIKAARKPSRKLRKGL
jgi:hypothetical protein